MTEYKELAARERRHDCNSAISQPLSNPKEKFPIPPRLPIFQISIMSSGRGVLSRAGAGKKVGGPRTGTSGDRTAGQRALDRRRIQQQRHQGVHRRLGDIVEKTVEAKFKAHDASLITQFSALLGSRLLPRPPFWGQLGRSPAEQLVRRGGDENVRRGVRGGRRRQEREN